jgi:DNA-binding MarR family transcriptional regulator/GNAT superfamily N-acetyltransferase
MAVSAAIFTASTHDPVHTIRRFNRFYTRQIGVLNEHLLQSEFSLTEVRVLYELAHRERVAAVELGRDLGLDRGYLSRMLQRFEKKGWIKTAASPDDRRKSFLSLTSKGRKVFSPLEQRSNNEVSVMLAKLSPAQQTNLLSAMSEIEGLLSHSQISLSQKSASAKAATQHTVPRDNSESADAPYILRTHRPGDMGWVVQSHGLLYSKEYGYDERFEALVAGIVAEFIEKFDPARERCWIAEKTTAEKDGINIGSVFLVKKSNSVAKLRMLLVDPSARGLGIGKRLVEECVRFAREAGYKKIMLWTQSELLAARRIYEGVGFKLISQEKHSSWSRKDLVAETWDLKL